MRAARCLTVAALLLAACTGPRQAGPPENPSVRLVLGGDVMLARRVEQVARLHGDPAWPFRRIAAFLAAADIAFVNLESPFSDGPPIANANMIFRAEPDTIAGLKLAGVDVVSVANNHTRDCGNYGLSYTLEWLDWHDILAAGAADDRSALREGVVLERKGSSFGFLAYTYDQANGNHRDADARIAVMDLATLKADIARMRARAGVIVVSMHAGVEYSPQPIRQQIEFARAAIDAGAKVVVGHHPHVVQPVEKYRDGVIFYSLGNLVFDQVQRPETQEGLLAEVVFNNNEIVSYSVQPVDIRDTAPRLRNAAGIPLTTPKLRR